MGIVRREMRLVQREAAPAETAAPSRVRSFVASNEAVDSYNTIIKSDGWDLERYDANPVVLFGHNGRQLPIGKGNAWVDGKQRQLMLDVEFFDEATNPLSEQTLKILDAGVMGASVGFEPIDYEYNAARETGDDWQDMMFPPLDYTKTRLLEVSIVTIPANPEALPVGREVQQRMLQRLAARIPTPAPKTEAPPVDLRALIENVVRQTRAEQQAAELRRRGKTSRS